MDHSPPKKSKNKINKKPPDVSTILNHEAIEEGFDKTNDIYIKLLNHFGVKRLSHPQLKKIILIVQKERQIERKRNDLRSIALCIKWLKENEDDLDAVLNHIILIPDQQDMDHYIIAQQQQVQTNNQIQQQTGSSISPPFQQNLQVQLSYHQQLQHYQQNQLSIPIPQPQNINHNEVVLASTTENEEDKEINENLFAVIPDRNTDPNMHSELKEVDEISSPLCFCEKQNSTNTSNVSQNNQFANNIDDIIQEMERFNQFAYLESSDELNVFK